jgi:hypothetical protein
VGSNPAVPILLKKPHRKGFQPQFNSLAEALFCWFVAELQREKDCFFTLEITLVPVGAIENLEGRLRLACPKTGKRNSLAMGVADTSPALTQGQLKKELTLAECHYNRNSPHQ